MHSLVLAVLAAIALAVSPARSLDCSGAERFACLADHASAEMARLSLSPTDDQRASFEALPALSLYVANGPEAAAKAWEARDLPVYDLILTLLLADREGDAEAAALATEKPFAFDADGKGIGGEAGYRQTREDLRAFYHGEEAMEYARACVSDEAFREEIGGGPEMREGACRVPYDPRAVQRAFGIMQLLKGVSRDRAVEATLQYAYRVPSCAVAAAVIDIMPSAEALAADAESAAWKVLDMATICAAEMLAGEPL